MNRSVTPPPLAPVEVELPQWPALVKARRRLAVIRSATGRMATLAGATAAATGLFTGELTGAALLADAALTLGGLVTLRLWKPQGHQRAAASALYLGPGVSLAALLVAEQIVPGIHWGEALALTAWTAGTWVLRPAEVARRMVTPPLSAPSTALVPVEEVANDHPAGRWWAQHVAIDGGAAPDTVLDDIQRTGETSMRAVIRSTIPGRPVPEVSIKHLSALMDIPEEEIDIGAVPGRGAGVRRLTIGQPDDDLATVWTKRIAPAAMPGTVLAGVRVGRPGASHTTAPTTRTEEDA
ncbi:hypothetical protein ACIBCT_31470 [Streptosporangium sp. NPDC050855]|uniref:hypothetical protein n=1 Tax=Streptosporangium sp. NPDC050855 TaxID=3366194 RepID=UPI003789F67A